MGIIMINCPATGRGVSTGIEVCATDQLPVVTATTAFDATDASEFVAVTTTL